MKTRINILYLQTKVIQEISIYDSAKMKKMNNSAAVLQHNCMHKLQRCNDDSGATGVHKLQL